MTIDQDRDNIRDKGSRLQVALTQANTQECSVKTKKKPEPGLRRGMNDEQSHCTTKA